MGDKYDSLLTIPSDETPRQGTLQDLYRHHWRELVAFIRQQVGAGPPEPEDVAQQSFTNFAALEAPEQVDNPRAFLYRTAANLITDYHRSAAHRRQHVAETLNLEKNAQTHDELSPEIVLLDRERFGRVIQAVRALPRRQRRFLLLHRVEGLSYTQIARRNGVSISTVRREVEAAAGACREAVLTMTDNDQE